VEFAYNAKLHSSIGVSPFFALYGQECRTPISLLTPNSRFESVNQMVRKMNEVIESVKVSMKDSQEWAKHYSDIKRSFREFEVGDKVFLKVTPQRSRLKLGKLKKLSLRFCGPFEIIKRIGPVAYSWVEIANSLENTQCVSCKSTREVCVGSYLCVIWPS
jgi:hypothetical protein